MAQETVTRTPTGKALEDLIVEIIYTFFLIRASGSRIGAVAPWGGSYWGMLRSLKLEGPQTVPQIARSRPVPRQSIQKLANEMLEDGLIEIEDNPAHRRSKLLRLTPKGEATFQELTQHTAQEAENLGHDMDAAELQIAVTVLKRLRDKLRESVKE